MPYRFIDLFAGLGGFHWALERLGCECVFASELKEDLRELYVINHPGVQIAGDITQIAPEAIPHHDILCAGFPCQPFSQAGKRQGFKDEKDRGNLFYNICDIVAYHRPKYILLENVANLLGHDKGNTWRVIHDMLTNDLEYDVAEPAILSPHEFGIPQHRKRIYIVCKDRHADGEPLAEYFQFPERTNEPTTVDSILIPDETAYVKIKPETRHQLEVWQEFVTRTYEIDGELPTFPIWAMEFGAKYPLNRAPSYQPLRVLHNSKGKFGISLKGMTKKECIRNLPKYAQTDKDKVFPDWKIRYIQQNREFYERHKKWLKKWMKQLNGFENSHIKFEWNCGKCATPILDDKIIQYRASGIRVKLPNFSPALNLVGTQIPILLWINLPKESLKNGEPDKGRYMTLREAARLQGMNDILFGSLSTTRAFEALGNAVNVDIVYLIARNLIR